MPAEEAFHCAEDPLGHPTEIPDRFIFVFHIFGNAVREDVVHHSAGDGETMAFQKAAAACPGVAVGYRAARLSFGVFRDQPIYLPELSLAVNEHNPEDLP